MRKDIVMLHLEDDDNAADLLKSYIETQKISCKIIRAKNSEEFTELLLNYPVNVILSKNTVADLVGIDALKFIRSKNKNLPFIFISDELNNYFLLSALRYGATDFILKNNIDELGSILKSAVKNYNSILNTEELNKKIHSNEERFRFVHKALNDVIWDIDLLNNQVIWSDNATEILKIKTDDLGKDFSWLIERIHPNDTNNVNLKLEELFTNKEEKLHLEFHFKCGDGNYAFIYFKAFVFYDNNDKPIRIIGSLMDFSDIEKINEELKQAKIDAEQSERLKTEFLAQMSHEIRTPLNIILNFAEIIKDDLNLEKDNEKKEIYEIMRNSGMRLIHTVDAVLGIAQLQSGTYNPKFKSIDLYSDILEKLYKEYRIKAQSKNLLLILKKETDYSKIYTDEFCVMQIFSNLIDNAIKYTDKGSVEILLGKDENDNICVTVSDTGIGISKEFLPFVFDSFRREEKGYTRRYEGNGLGLALVKNYCSIIKAEISVESKKNVGTKFRVVFK